jgi:hypothetical protein
VQRQVEYGNFASNALLVNDKYGKVAYCSSTEINRITPHKRINPKVRSCLLVSTVVICISDAQIPNVELFNSRYTRAIELGPC